jgi:hypothetical protein
VKYIRKISDYAIVGGIGAIAAFGIIGCSDNTGNQAAQNAQAQGAFVIIEAQPNGGYKVLEEHPSPITRVVVRELNGTERFLSQAEIDELLAQENAKIDAGASPLTNSSVSSGTPGLGQVILSSMAGAMLGAWIGNKLFGNSNYQNQRQTSYKSPQSYSRSVDSFNKASSTARTSSGAKSGGFFGGGSKAGSSGSFGG